jgi:hypothetical protein
MEESEKTESMTEKRNQRELLWFQPGGALNFITAAPHCGDVKGGKGLPNLGPTTD